LRSGGGTPRLRAAYWNADNLAGKVLAPRFLIHEFLTDRKSSILGGLGGPGRPGNLPERYKVRTRWKPKSIQDESQKRTRRKPKSVQDGSPKCTRWKPRTHKMEAKSVQDGNSKAHKMEAKAYKMEIKSVQDETHGRPSIERGKEQTRKGTENKTEKGRERAGERIEKGFDLWIIFGAVKSPNLLFSFLSSLTSSPLIFTFSPLLSSSRLSLSVRFSCFLFSRTPRMAEERLEQRLLHFCSLVLRCLSLAVRTWPRKARERSEKGYLLSYRLLHCLLVSSLLSSLIIILSSLLSFSRLLSSCSFHIVSYILLQSEKGRRKA